MNVSLDPVTREVKVDRFDPVLDLPERVLAGANPARLRWSPAEGLLGIVASNGIGTYRFVGQHPDGCVSRFQLVALTQGRPS